MTFSVEMEQKLVAYIKKVDNMFYGLTRCEVMCLAFQFAEKNNIPRQFSRNKKIAGSTWFYSFQKRNNLSVRSPQKCSIARAIGFNKVQIDKFFENLKTIYDKFHFHPRRIYNMDENNGLSTVPNKMLKVSK